MKNKTRNVVKVILILCISMFFIYLIFKYQRFFQHINIRSLRKYILSFGPFSFFALLLIYSLKPLVVVFPAVLLTILAGNIYGPVKGFILSMAGVFFSATLAFYISKSIGKPFVDKITRGKLLKLDDNIEAYGFKIIFFMRLSTLFPIDPLSYAVGLTKMKYSDFILGTLLGLFPEMLAYSYLGQSMRHPFSKKIFIPLILIAAVAAGGAFIYKSSKSKNRNSA
jgi:uncharacterized membrane protein YdjX (TVP38/TMEM64 family)